MDKVAHTEMYLGVLEKCSKVSDHIPVVRHLPGKDKEKKPLVGIPGGIAFGGLAGSALGRVAVKDLGRAFRMSQHDLNSRGTKAGLLMGMLLGGGLAAANLKKNYWNKKPSSKKEAHDQEYIAALEKVARKYTAKETEIGTAGNIGAGLLGPLQAFGAPEGRRLRTAGHIYGKGLIGNISGRVVADALSKIMRHNPIEAAVLKGALAMTGTAAGSIHGYHTGKKGRKFFDSMGD